MASSSRLPPPPCTDSADSRAGQLESDAPQSDSRDTESTLELLESLSLSDSLPSPSSSTTITTGLSRPNDDHSSNSTPQSSPVSSSSPVITPQPEPIDGLPEQQDDCTIKPSNDKPLIKFVFHEGRRKLVCDSVDDITEALENVQMDRPSSKTGAMRNNLRTCRTARVSPWQSEGPRFKIRNLCRDIDNTLNPLAGVPSYCFKSPPSSRRSPRSPRPPVVDRPTRQEKGDNEDDSLMDDLEEAEDERQSSSDSDEDAMVHEESGSARGDDTDGDNGHQDEEDDSPEAPRTWFPPRMPTPAPSSRVEDESPHATHAVLSSGVKEDGDEDGDDVETSLGEEEGEEEEEEEGDAEVETEPESHIPDSETRTPEQLQAAAHQLLEEILDAQSSIVHPTSLPEVSSPAEHQLRLLPAVESPQRPSFVVATGPPSDLRPQDGSPTPKPRYADVDTLGDHEDDHGTLLQPSEYATDPDEQSRSPSRRSPSPPAQAPTIRTTVAAVVQPVLAPISVTFQPPSPPRASEALLCPTSPHPSVPVAMPFSSNYASTSSSFAPSIHVPVVPSVPILPSILTVPEPSDVVMDEDTSCMTRPDRAFPRRHSISPRFVPVISLHPRAVVYRYPSPSTPSPPRRDWKSKPARRSPRHTPDPRNRNDRAHARRLDQYRLRHELVARARERFSHRPNATTDTRTSVTGPSATLATAIVPMLDGMEVDDESWSLAQPASSLSLPAVTAVLEDVAMQSTAFQPQVPGALPRVCDDDVELPDASPERPEHPAQSAPAAAPHSSELIKDTSVPSTAAQAQTIDTIDIAPSASLAIAAQTDSEPGEAASASVEATASAQPTQVDTSSTQSSQVDAPVIAVGDPLSQLYFGNGDPSFLYYDPEAEYDAQEYADEDEETDSDDDDPSQWEIVPIAPHDPPAVDDASPSEETQTVVSTHEDTPSTPAKAATPEHAMPTEPASETTAAVEVAPAVELSPVVEHAPAAPSTPLAATIEAASQADASEDSILPPPPVPKVIAPSSLMYALGAPSASQATSPRHSSASVPSSVSSPSQALAPAPRTPAVQPSHLSSPASPAPTSLADPSTPNTALHHPDGLIMEPAPSAPVSVDTWRDRNARLSLLAQAAAVSSRMSSSGMGPSAKKRANLEKARREKAAREAIIASAIGDRSPQLERDPEPSAPESHAASNPAASPAPALLEDAGIVAPIVQVTADDSSALQSSKHADPRASESEVAEKRAPDVEAPVEEAAPQVEIDTSAVDPGTSENIVVQDEPQSVEVADEVSSAPEESQEPPQALPDPAPVPKADEYWEEDAISLGDDDEWGGVHPTVDAEAPHENQESQETSEPPQDKGKGRMTEEEYQKMMEEQQKDVGAKSTEELSVPVPDDDLLQQSSVPSLPAELGNSVTDQEREEDLVAWQAILEQKAQQAHLEALRPLSNPSSPADEGYGTSSTQPSPELTRGRRFSSTSAPSTSGWACCSLVPEDEGVYTSPSEKKLPSIEESTVSTTETPVETPPVLHAAIPASSSEPDVEMDEPEVKRSRFVESKIAQPKSDMLSVASDKRPKARGRQAQHRSISRIQNSKRAHLKKVESPSHVDPDPSTTLNTGDTPADNQSGLVFASSAFTFSQPATPSATDPVLHTPPIVAIGDTPANNQPGLVSFASSSFTFSQAATPSATDPVPLSPTLVASSQELHADPVFDIPSITVLDFSNLPLPNDASDSADAQSFEIDFGLDEVLFPLPTAPCAGVWSPDTASVPNMDTAVDEHVAAASDGTPYPVDASSFDPLSLSPNDTGEATAAIMDSDIAPYGVRDQFEANGLGLFSQVEGEALVRDIEEFLRSHPGFIRDWRDHREYVDIAIQCALEGDTPAGSVHLDLQLDGTPSMHTDATSSVAHSIVPPVSEPVAQASKEDVVDAAPRIEEAGEVGPTESPLPELALELRPVAVTEETSAVNDRATSLESPVVDPESVAAEGCAGADPVHPGSTTREAAHPAVTSDMHLTSLICGHDTARLDSADHCAPAVVARPPPIDPEDFAKLSVIEPPQPPPSPVRSVQRLHGRTKLVPASFWAAGGPFIQRVSSRRSRRVPRRRRVRNVGSIESTNPSPTVEHRSTHDQGSAVLARGRLPSPLRALSQTFPSTSLPKRPVPPRPQTTFSGYFRASHASFRFTAPAYTPASPSSPSSSSSSLSSSDSEDEGTDVMSAPLRCTAVSDEDSEGSVAASGGEDDCAHDQGQGIEDSFRGDPPFDWASKLTLALIAFQLARSAVDLCSHIVSVF